MSAELETLEIATATAGASETFGLAAPVVASVIIESTDDAASVRSCAPVSVEEFSSPAKVESLTIESATEAPIPIVEPEPPLACFGFARTVDSDEDAAVSATSPPPAVTTPVGLIEADVERFAMFSASAPATPTWPPPPPATASAPRLFFSPAPFIEASTETPIAVAAPAIDASFDTFASVIATAAPIATEPAEFALPSAEVDASVFPCDLSERSPPAETLVPAGIVALDETVAIVIATAAATLIPPPEVDADGVAVVPEP